MILYRKRLIGLWMWMVCSFLSAEPWSSYANLEEAGFSSGGMEEAFEQAREFGSAAVFVTVGGRVVASWGEVDRPLKCYSIRKSLLNALYGPVVAEGKIDLEATLADLGIDDLQGLSAQEKKARVEHLLQARSGIYHPSAYEPASMKRRRPVRGSSEPGERWFYNNWDFNVAGTIYEQAVGRDLHSAFAEEIAGPIGMEDFGLEEDTFDWLEPSVSLHEAYLFKLSTRDLARFGHLILERGRWRGTSLIPEEWIEESLQAYTRFTDEEGEKTGDGYGYMWWTFGATERKGVSIPSSFAAQGADGELLLVVPDFEMVYVHRSYEEFGEGLDMGAALEIFDAVVRARLRAPSISPDLIPSGKARKLRERAPREPGLPRSPVASELRERLVGDYRVGDRFQVRIHEYENRLFADPQGAPLAEVELVQASEGLLLNPWIQMRVRIVSTDSMGKIRKLELHTPDGRVLPALRIEEGSGG